MKAKTLSWSILAAFAAAIAATGAVAQQGGPGGGGGNKPPVELSNNLSYPAVLTAGTVTLPGFPGTATLAGTFPTAMSYGCAVPEGDYSNTSCVTLAGVPESYEACAARCGAVPVERIYWQKQSANAWQAENLQNAGIQVANYADWGDNLETVTWTASSAIRVELTPFATLPETLLGFQMWHVFGQGPDELWGVRAAGDPASVPAAYAYESAYPIIRSPNAKLNLSKLNTAAEACTGPSPYAAAFVWNAAAENQWGAIEVADLAFSPELNIGGKFVYGYNWNTKRLVMPAGADKAGWWRLTFYAPDIQFAPGTVTAPPPIPDAVPLVPNSGLMDRISILADEGALYVPVVDSVNHITYIDICLAGGRGNSGRSR